MSISDHEFVNFSEDYELDYRLRSVGKSQSVTNRATLRTMGDELKKSLGKTILNHGEFRAYIEARLYRLI